MPNKLSKSELKDIIQWDVANWKYALEFWESYYPVKPGMKVLILGERDGGLSVYFAKKKCSVICSDLTEISDRAKEMHKQYELMNSITYEKLDIRKIKFESDQFDIVVFKSVIGAVKSGDEQQNSIAEIRRVLKSGGAFLFAENASASKLHMFLRKKFTNWQDHWHYPSDNEMNHWKSHFSRCFSKKLGFIALFGRNENQRRLLSYFDRLFQFCVPKKWRYIFIGVYIK